MCTDWWTSLELWLVFGKWWSFDYLEFCLESLKSVKSWSLKSRVFCILQWCCAEWGLNLRYSSGYSSFVSCMISISWHKCRHQNVPIFRFMNLAPIMLDGISHVRDIKTYHCKADRKIVNHMKTFLAGKVEKYRSVGERDLISEWQHHRYKEVSKLKLINSINTIKRLYDLCTTTTFSPRMGFPEQAQKPGPNVKERRKYCLLLAARYSWPSTTMVALCWLWTTVVKSVLVKLHFTLQNAEVVLW